MPNTKEICEDAMRSLASMQTSHDIIPRHHLPACILNPDTGLPSYTLAEHEQAVLPEYIRYTESARQIRNILDQYTAKKHYDSPVVWRCLMTTFLGVGECHETSNRLVVELVKRGIFTVYFLYLVGYLDQPDTRPTYNHVLLMVADHPIHISKKQITLKDFFKDHSGWVLDGLLNLVKYSSEYMLDPVAQEYTRLHHFLVNECIEFNRNRAVTQEVAQRVEREARNALQPLIENQVVIPFLRLQTAVILKGMNDDHLNGRYAEIYHAQCLEGKIKYIVIDRGGQKHAITSKQCQRVSDVITAGCWVVLSNLRQQQFNNAHAELQSYYKDRHGMQRCQLKLDPAIVSADKVVNQLGVLATKITLLKQHEVQYLE